MKLEWGFDRFIPLKAFGDATNGYLVDDCCVFGAEVFVCKERTKGKTECLTMIKDANTYKHSWKIEKYSESDAVCYKEFYAGDKKWYLSMYKSSVYIYRPDQVRTGPLATNFRRQNMGFVAKGAVIHTKFGPIITDHL